MIVVDISRKKAEANKKIADSRMLNVEDNDVCNWKRTSWPVGHVKFANVFIHCNGDNFL